MKNLIIITPKAFGEGKFLEVMQKIAKNNYKIIGLKLEKMDIFGIEKKVGKETNKNKIKEMSKLLKTPCVLIAIEGEGSIKFGNSLKEEYGKEYLHNSSSQQVADYEIERFFEKKEIFE